MRVHFFRRNSVTVRCSMDVHGFMTPFSGTRGLSKRPATTPKKVNYNIEKSLSLPFYFKTGHTWSTAPL